MCILLALQPKGPQVRFPLIIAHNRDELRARRTGALGVEASTGLCCARDYQGGGMDMAFHVQSGRFAVLNNCRCLTRYPDDDPEKLSRGRLVESGRLLSSCPVSDWSATGREIYLCSSSVDPYYLFHVDNAYTAKPSLRVYNHAPKHPTLTTSSVAWDDSVREVAEEVFVKSNEALWCEHPWPKSQFLEERGRKLISELPDYSSLEDVTAAVAEVMSRSNPVCTRDQWGASAEAISTWSPDPDHEWWKVQAPFLAGSKDCIT
ncbi:hypothetical protein FOZ63_008083 [Perkinsus olseni]|uniref:Uncharacterized protein n=1 Tax=Perkinsus olseni TaxID=32597 RepID=A0A7J6UAN9_PEROL|nr:hypothetical protein FOZ63_008083 [Perkinsus olseni]